MDQLFQSDSSPPTDSRPHPDWWHNMAQLYYIAVPPQPRRHSRLLYVVHLFSGGKRPGDLHQWVAQMPAADNGILCPISLDVVLDPDRCDLVSPRWQQYWIERALSGAVYCFVAGPPCETWSISRFRYFDEHKGPRPVRSADTWESFWALPTLTLRELHQVLIGNQLLQFALLICCCQMVSRNLSLLEHPTEGDVRHQILPPFFVALLLVC